MSIPHRVSDILQNHVTFELECIDRMYLNAYVPGLQYEGGVVGFFRGHRGQKFASSALMDPITQAAPGTSLFLVGTRAALSRMPTWAQLSVEPALDFEPAYG